MLHNNFSDQNFNLTGVTVNLATKQSSELHVWRCWLNGNEYRMSEKLFEIQIRHSVCLAISIQIFILGGRGKAVFLLVK